MEQNLRDKLPVCGRERWDREREINCQCVGERDGTERDKLSVCGRERWDRER